MIRTIKRILIPIAILFVLGMALFLINQIAGVYLLLASFNSLLATIALVIMVTAAVALVSWPVWLIVKLPQPLKLPQSNSELVDYRKRLVNRLSSTKY